MTPKEKAQELILRFYYLLPNNGFHKEGINSCNSRYKEAINCALVAVDEIIVSNGDFANTSNVWYDENGKIADYTDCSNYWQQVKQEIEKIKQEYE